MLDITIPIGLALGDLTGSKLDIKLSSKEVLRIIPYNTTASQICLANGYSLFINVPFMSLGQVISKARTAQGLSPLPNAF